MLRSLERSRICGIFWVIKVHISTIRCSVDTLTMAPLSQPGLEAMLGRILRVSGKCAKFYVQFTL